MFRRILFSTVAAASVATAAPALAAGSAPRAEKNGQADVPACCARVAAMHERDRARVSADATKAQQPKREAKPSFESNPADYQYMFDYQGG